MNGAELQRLKQKYDIIGNNAELNRALDISVQVAPTDLSVLITGENGVGKEIFPRIIHDRSLRKGKKYFAINCGSIPEGTIDSELFGHEKGAFTGAVNERDGYFGVANGGTLFLDEVGELPKPTQARLLRVLETGEYIRVGASEVRKTNVRIVAATNLNVPKAISEGRFREDLYYRLNTIPVHIPSLRERGEDIVLLFRKFALDMSEKYNMPPLRLDEAAKQRLMAFSWPGNVRQLKNVTENMSITSNGREITPEILDFYIPKDMQSTQLVAVSGNTQQHSFESEREILYKIFFDLRRDVTDLKNLVARQEEEIKSLGVKTISAPTTQISPVSKVLPVEEYVEEAQEGFSMDDIEKEAIKKTLERNRGARKQTADDLGISERTLYRKIKEYGLE